MSRLVPVFACLLCAGLLLTACSENKKSGLVSKLLGTSKRGPDEFLVLPQKPLEMPADFAKLPEPVPGAGNRVDLHPLEDAQIALAGRPVATTGISRSDQALLAATGALSVPANIREILAREDAQLRADKPGQFLERLFSQDDEMLTYESMMLDPLAELARLRARGVTTPAAPPPGPP
ncbi:MAG: DUF3035 domain-containing protein [Paracoccaceae bacterium]